MVKLTAQEVHQCSENQRNTDWEKLTPGSKLLYYEIANSDYSFEQMTKMFDDLVQKKMCSYGSLNSTFTFFNRIQEKAKTKEYNEKFVEKLKE